MQLDCVLHHSAATTASTLKPPWHALWVVCSLTLSQPCQAQPIEQSPAETELESPQTTVDQLIDDGVRHYHDGEYRLAITRFANAYATNGDPNLLFNIGRCHEALEQGSKAIENYEAYLASEGIDSLGAQRARAALKQLTSAGELTSNADPTLQSPVDGASPQPPAVSDSPDEQQDPRRKRSAWPLVTLASGLGGLAGGAIVFAWGQHDHRAVTSAAGYGESSERFDLTRAEAQRLVNDGDQKKAIAMASMSIGAALAVTGVTWLLVRRHDSSASISMGVYAWASGGNASIRGEF